MPRRLLTPLGRDHEYVKVLDLEKSR